VVRTFVTLWDQAPLHGASFAGLMRLATGSPGGAALLGGYIAGALTDALSRALGLGGTRRDRRAIRSHRAAVAHHRRK
jgi:hypothetical protein